MRFPWATEVLSKPWFFAAYQFAFNLAKYANLISHLCDSTVEYYLVFEASHFHLEITLNGEAPNIKGWEKGTYFYATEEVKEKLKGGDTT